MPLQQQQQRQRQRQRQQQQQQQQQPLTRTAPSLMKIGNNIENLSIGKKRLNTISVSHGPAPLAMALPAVGIIHRLLRMSYVIRIR